MSEACRHADLLPPGPVGRPRRGSRLAASVAALLLAAAAVLAPIGCSEEGPAERAAAPEAEESFTFYGLGAHSVFTEAVRRRLRDELGNEAISHRSIVDLETTAPGFLAAHLPELDLLNRRLNDPPGERVDHDVVKLMYRYARQHNVPFDYVELVFSGFSQRPILFHIRFKADEAATVEALRRRHGEPQVIDWGGGLSLVWRREGELLLVSRVPDRLGEIGHRISFYFLENIGQMLDAERKEREQKALERQKTGKTAF